MSATQLAAFITACLVSAVLMGLGTVVVWKLRPNIDNNAGPGLWALGLGLFAVTVFAAGASVANNDPNAPPPNSSVHGCQPGTYDNGSNGDGPKCIPWPPGAR